MPKRRRERKKSYLAIIVVVILITIAAASAGYLLSRNAPTTSTTSFEFTSKPEISTYVTEYPTQASSTSPNAIAVDAQGNIWFALWNLSDIAELNPVNGTIHEYHVPGIKPGAMNTWGMAVDNSRNIVWFPEFSSNSIWGFNITSGKFTQYVVKTPNCHSLLRRTRSKSRSVVYRGIRKQARGALSQWLDDGIHGSAGRRSGADGNHRGFHREGLVHHAGDEFHWFVLPRQFHN